MWYYSSCFIELSFFPLIFSSYHPTQRNGQRFSYIVKGQLSFYLFSQFFSIIFVLCHSFFQSSTCFPFMLIQKIITVYFIKYSWSFHFFSLVLFLLVLLILLFLSVVNCCKMIFSCVPLYFSTTPFWYWINNFNGSRPLLLFSELWTCKVSLIVLLITFNEYPFNCMVFLIHDILQLMIFDRC